MRESVKDKAFQYSMTAVLCILGIIAIIPLISGNVFQFQGCSGYEHC